MRLTWQSSGPGSIGRPVTQIEAVLAIPAYLPGLARALWGMATAVPRGVWRGIFGVA